MGEGVKQDYSYRVVEGLLDLLHYPSTFTVAEVPHTYSATVLRAHIRRAGAHVKEQ